MNRHTLKIKALILAAPFWRLSAALAADPPLPGTGLRIFFRPVLK